MGSYISIQYSDKTLNSTKLGQWLLSWAAMLEPAGSTTILLPKKKDGSLNKDPALNQDKDGHLLFEVGDMFENRYQIMSLLGKGTFGQVAEVMDTKTNTIIALKIIRENKKLTKSLFRQSEITCLKTIQERDPNKTSLCIHMLECFRIGNHVCISFPVYGESVYEFLKSNKFIPYPMEQIKHISYQVACALKFLHGIGLIHTDLKPENILFVTKDWKYVCHDRKKNHIRRMKDTRIRLIDFGSATFQWEYHSKTVSTRNYRAPEVIMLIGWSFPCDIWSLGCIIFELYNGSNPFCIDDDITHLALMERFVGISIPTDLIKKSKTKYFDKEKLIWNSSHSNYNIVNKHCKKMTNYLGKRQDTVKDLEKHMTDMLNQIFVFNPRQRISIQGILQHPYFSSTTS